MGCPLDRIHRVIGNIGHIHPKKRLGNGASTFNFLQIGIQWKRESVAKKGSSGTHNKMKLFVEIIQQKSTDSKIRKIYPIEIKHKVRPSNDILPSYVISVVVDLH